MINEWNKLSNHCVNASKVNMSKNKINIYLIKARYKLLEANGFFVHLQTTITLYFFWKPMASLSTCHLERVVVDGNLVKSC